MCVSGGCWAETAGLGLRGCWDCHTPPRDFEATGEARREKGAQMLPRLNELLYRYFRDPGGLSLEESREVYGVLGRAGYSQVLETPA